MLPGLRVRPWRKHASRNVVTATLAECDGSQTYMSYNLIPERVRLSLRERGETRVDTFLHLFRPASYPCGCGANTCTHMRTDSNGMLARFCLPYFKSVHTFINCANGGYLKVCCAAVISRPGALTSGTAELMYFMLTISTCTLADAGYAAPHHLSRGAACGPAGPHGPEQRSAGVPGQVVGEQGTDTAAGPGGLNVCPS